MAQTRKRPAQQSEALLVYQFCSFISERLATHFSVSLAIAHALFA
jgi:hypothetical protein